MRLVNSFWKNERGSMVGDIAKAAGGIALLSVVAANFVSQKAPDLDRDRLAQASLAASKRQPVDPMVTGSIGRAAGETKLDPCVLQR